MPESILAEGPPIRQSADTAFQRAELAAGPARYAWA
jgi:hypothetical protein